ncbi:hypothetical protein [Stenotrophomonas mori]|uniref:Secreted protein n=1 Tax=Stenotrophomonas mori TaxID=2871096 RepID=A0ABT0SCY0_9GAMM|nr:hypothetical protein [Stenotrophomonas mori]MCL7713169.1 hypothetical protein [Stenotrophomonas mori]
MSRSLLVGVALLVSGSCLAKPPEPPLRPALPFAAQHERIRADLQAGERYSEISATDRQRVAEALERMAQAIGEGNAEALPPERRARVFNDQELVNTLLARAREDSRLVCRREKPIGSRMPVTQCQTVAERGRMRQDADSQLRHVQEGRIIKAND